jgi:hypothetical protein
MKQYMNRNDRDHHEFMLIAYEYLTSWLLQATCLTPKERGRIKSACTNLLHASDSIVQRLESDYARKLLKDLKRVAIKMVDKTTATEGDIQVNIDDLYDLADMAMDECVGCERHDHKECDRFKLYFKLNVPVARTETTGCPYEN